MLTSMNSYPALLPRCRLRIRITRFLIMAISALGYLLWCPETKTTFTITVANKNQNFVCNVQ